MSALLIYIVIFALFFWFMGRNNKKRQQEELKKEQSLKPGMFVTLRDGFYGTIVDTEDSTIVVNLSIDGSDAGCVRTSRSAVDKILDEADIPMTAGHDEVEEAVKVTDYSLTPDEKTGEDDSAGAAEKKAEPEEAEEEKEREDESCQ